MRRVWAPLPKLIAPVPAAAEVTAPKVPVVVPESSSVPAVRNVPPE
ncbi:hypothetical protein CFIICLFH_3822 [Methylobacterium goesingense]|nr:hypothetical protein CFIICLFH_3822 [Methylobacterium goesingense]